jgi:hypothetical protein
MFNKKYLLTATVALLCACAPAFVRFQDTSIFHQFNGMDVAIKTADSTVHGEYPIVVVGFPIKTIVEHNRSYTIFALGKPEYDPGNETNYQWAALKVFDPEKAASVNITASNRYIAIMADLPNMKYRTVDMDRKRYAYCLQVQKTSMKIKSNKEDIFNEADHHSERPQPPDTDSLFVFSLVAPGKLPSESDNNGGEPLFCGFQNEYGGINDITNPGYFHENITLPPLPPELMDLPWSPVFIAEDYYELKRPDSPVPQTLSLRINLKRTIEFYTKLSQNKNRGNFFLVPAEIERILAWLRNCQKNADNP